MAVRKLMEVLGDKCRSLLRAEDGNMAIMIAGAVLPLVVITGAAVDYGRAVTVRSAMQSAADATALWVSRNAASLTADQLRSEALSYFTATLARSDVQGVQVDVAYTTNPGSQVTVTATANVPTTLMALAAIKQMPVAASATAAWGTTRLRVALVLDNTGSMSQSGKMDALKTAAKNLISQLQKAAQTNGDVYVSIIPFSKDVNVGPSNWAQNWINWSEWDSKNGTCSKSKYKSKSDCTKNGGTWTPKAHNAWNGCVMDRDQNYDITNTAPIPYDPSTPSTLFPAEQYSSCPVELMPLSYDWAQLKSKIDSMLPQGTTNQGIGLAWGWQSLTQGSPLNAPAEDPDYKYQKVIILLSDGLNTQNRWSTNQAAIDARQKLMCDNVKNAGITLYTVQVNTDGAPTSTLLQYCASDASKFFLLTAASQIITTFDQIGTNLSKLRIAK